MKSQSTIRAHIRELRGFIDEVNAFAMRAWRRLWLFVRIVGRKWDTIDGVDCRISFSKAMKIAKIIWP